jgi:hypothetical protein
MELRKTGVFLLALLLAGMAIVPIVSAADNPSASLTEPFSRIDSNAANKTSTAVTPYADIAVYPSTNNAAIGQSVSVYTSGDIGNIVNYYYQRLYIKDLSTGLVVTTCYVSTPSGWSEVIPGNWEKAGWVVGYDTFSSAWTVRFNQAGAYQVVASVVGTALIPNAQSSTVIMVT